MYPCTKERDLIKYENPSSYLPAVVGPSGVAGLLSAKWILFFSVFIKPAGLANKPRALSAWTFWRIWFDCVYIPSAPQHSTTPPSLRPKLQPANSKGEGKKKTYRSRHSHRSSEEERKDRNRELHLERVCLKNITHLLVTSSTDGEY